MLDLDEGERLREQCRVDSVSTVPAYVKTYSHHAAQDWYWKHAPTLIAELRAARETIAALRGELQCERTKGTCP
jgi:hypothetical protein